MMFRGPVTSRRTPSHPGSILTITRENQCESSASPLRRFIRPVHTTVVVCGPGTCCSSQVAQRTALRLRTEHRWSSYTSCSTELREWPLRKAADVAKLTTFVSDPGDWFPFEGEQIDIYHEFFGQDYPVNTIIGAQFPADNIRVEIDAIAVLD